MEENETPQATDTNFDTECPPEMKDELWKSRRRMAWVSLWAIIIPTCYVILRINNVDVLNQIADLMSWYYLALASIVGAYFGFKSWAQIKGRDKS